MDVRVNATAPLRLDGAKVSADVPERPTRPRGGHAVGDARRAASRHHAHDMLQEQLQHEVRHHGLRHRVRRHPPEHLLRRRHGGRVLLQQPPARHVGALVHQRDHHVPSVRNVRRRKHQGRPEQPGVAGTDVPQRRPMRVGTNDLRVAEKHAAEGTLHVRGHGVAAQGGFEAGPLSEHSRGLDELFGLQGREVRNAVAEVLRAHEVPGLLYDSLPAPQAILSREEVHVAAPTRHWRLRRGGRVSRPRRRDVIVHLVLELLSRHEVPAPLGVREIRVSLKPKDAVAIRERNGIEGAPESRGKHADGLRPGRHDDSEHAPGPPAVGAAASVTAPRGNVVDAAAVGNAARARSRARRKNPWRRTSRLNLLVSLFQPGPHSRHVEGLRSLLSLFRGLRESSLEISVLEILHPLQLPRARLHPLPLGVDKLSLLEARQHFLPLTIQIALHVVIGDSGAVLALLNGAGAHALSAVARFALPRAPIGVVFAVAGYIYSANPRAAAPPVLRALGGARVAPSRFRRGRVYAGLHGLGRTFLARAAALPPDGDARGETARQAQQGRSIAIGLIEIPLCLGVPPHRGVLLVRVAEVFVGALQHLEGHAQLPEKRALHVGGVGARENNLHELHEVGLPRRQRQDLATAVRLREGHEIPHVRLDALLQRPRHARVCLAVESPNDAPRDGEQKLSAKGEIPQRQWQPTHPKIVRQGERGHLGNPLPQSTTTTVADGHLLRRVGHEPAARPLNETETFLVQQPKLPVGPRVPHCRSLQLLPGNAALPINTVGALANEPPPGPVPGRIQESVGALTLSEAHGLCLRSTAARPRPLRLDLGARRAPGLVVAEERTLLGAVRLTPEVHALQLVRPVKTGADAAADPGAHGAAIPSRLSARGARPRRRRAQGVDVHSRLPRPPRRKVASRARRLPPGAPSHRRSAGGDSTSSGVNGSCARRPIRRPRNEVLREGLHALPPLLRHHRPLATRLLGQVEQALPVLRPPVVRAVQVAHEASTRGEVLVAKSAREGGQRHRLLPKLPQGTSLLPGQAHVIRLENGHPRLATGRARHGLRRRATAGLLLAQARLPHGHLIAVPGFSRQRPVPALGVPSPEGSLIRLAMLSTKIASVAEHVPALAKHGLASVRSPDARDAPAGDALGLVQEPGRQSALLAHQRVLQSHVHTHVPRHHVLPCGADPLCLQLPLRLNYTASPRAPLPRGRRPFRCAAAQPTPSKPPRAPAPVARAPPARTQRRLSTARTAARRRQTTTTATARAVGRRRPITRALFHRRLVREPCQAQPVSALSPAPGTQERLRIRLHSPPDLPRQLRLPEVVVAGPTSPTSERIWPDTMKVTELLEFIQNLAVLPCGRRVILENGEQTLLVHVPVRPGAVPGEARASPLLASRARHPGRGARPLLEELQPDRPVGDRLRLHVRVIHWRPATRQTLLSACGLCQVHDVADALEVEQARREGVAHVCDAATRTAPRPQQPQLRGHVPGLARVVPAPPRRESFGEPRLRRLREPGTTGSSPGSRDAQDARPGHELAPVGPHAPVPGLQGPSLHEPHVRGAGCLVEALVAQQKTKPREELHPPRSHAPGRRRTAPCASALRLHRPARHVHGRLLRRELQPLPPMSDLLIRENILAPLAHEIPLALGAQEIRGQAHQHAAVHRGATGCALRPRRLFCVPRLPRGLAHLPPPPDLALSGVQGRQERHATRLGAAVGAQRRAPAQRLAAAAHPDLALHAVLLEPVKQALPLLPGLLHVRRRHRRPAQQVRVLPAQAPDGSRPRLIVVRRGLVAPQADLHQAQEVRHRVHAREETRRDGDIRHHARQNVPHVALTHSANAERGLALLGNLCPLLPQAQRRGNLLAGRESAEDAEAEGGARLQRAHERNQSPRERVLQ